VRRLEFVTVTCRTRRCVYIDDGQQDSRTLFISRLTGPVAQFAGQCTAHSRENYAGISYALLFPSLALRHERSHRLIVSGIDLLG